MQSRPACKKRARRTGTLRASTWRTQERHEQERHTAPCKDHTVSRARGAYAAMRQRMRPVDLPRVPPRGP